MKPDIHPKYLTTKVTCACGNAFETRATVPEIKVGICNQCHPFYTGKMKYVDQTGRVERFLEKYRDRGENYGVDLKTQQGQKRKLSRLDKIPKGVARDERGNLLDAARARARKKTEGAAPAAPPAPPAPPAAALAPPAPPAES